MEDNLIVIIDEDENEAYVFQPLEDETYQDAMDRVKERLRRASPGKLRWYCNVRVM